MENKDTRSWESIIRAFLKSKEEAEEEKYLKDLFKKITKAYDKEGLLKQPDIKTFFDTKKNKKSEGQTPLEFQQEKLSAARMLTVFPADINWDDVNTSYQAKCIELAEKYRPERWIEEASSKASSVSFATHVVKLTHSKIDTPSIFDQINAVRADVLTTSSLTEKIIDGAVAGNQFAPIYQFLELENNGLKLASELVSEHSEVLKPFVSQDEQLSNWNEAFKQASVTNEMAAHSLLKQVYFPISTETEHQYHLLCPVVSSTLAHSIVDHLFSEGSEKVRQQFEKGKYCSVAKTFYLGRAKLSVTASNHSNASQLNGKRGGKLHLLSAKPPVWTRKISPPVNRKSWFDFGIPYVSVQEDIQYLRDFLIRFDKLELSTRNPKRRRWLISWVTGIVDEVLFHANMIQTLSPGWTDIPTIKLKQEHQYFLDPFRVDDEFQAKMRRVEWQRVVCRDFAHWLNRQIQGRDKIFTPQTEHTRLWGAIIEPQLRELTQTLQAEQQKRKQPA